MPKLALITGACGGIGQAIASRFAKDGIHLALTDMNAKVLAEQQTNLSSLTEVSIYPGDLTDANFCDQLIAKISDDIGNINILVNNAGYMTRGKITETSDEDLAKSLQINVEAPFRLCRAAIPVMQAQGGGAIINIASCWGIYPGPDHVIYCTTKAAIAAMTRCLGRDHARDQIRVNAVCPNEVNTPMLRTGFEIRGLDSDKAIAQLNESVPLGRIAEPEDIANVVAFLASADAGYLCGSLIEVNGGKPVY